MLLALMVGGTAVPWDVVEVQLLRPSPLVNLDRI